MLVLILGLSCLWGLPLEAAKAEPAREEQKENPLASGNDPEDLHEALQTLSEAGVPPTREELSRLLQHPDREPPGPPGRALPFHGQLRLRWGHYQREGTDTYGKASLESTWLRMRTRFRKYRSGRREETASLEAGKELWEIRLGALGVNHGHGLLIAAPGRRATLTADSGFAPPRSRLVSWLGARDPHSFTGLGAALRLGIWGCAYLTGRRNTATNGQGRQVDFFQLGLAQGETRLTLAGLRDGAGRGASLAGGWRSKGLTGSWETLVWWAGPDLPPRGAAVMRVRWDLIRGTGVEGIFGASDLASASGLAGRPAFLPGWVGRGFALRFYTRNESGLKLWVLAQHGRHLDLRGSPSRNGKTLVELQVGKRWSGWLDLGARFRQSRHQFWIWSVRYPWQPARPGIPRRRSVLSVWIAAERDPWRARLLVRTLGQEQEGLSGRRTLLALAGVHGIGRNARIRGTWVTAWGDSVDLVSAVVPLTGMVLPRHWGHWSSETVLGLEWTFRAVRLHAAGSLRHPGQEAGAPSPVATFWLETELRW
jgi:hypothetical protein